MTEGPDKQQRAILIALLGAPCASMEDLFYRVVSAEDRTYAGRARDAKLVALSEAAEGLREDGLATLERDDALASKALALTKRGEIYAGGLQAITRGIAKAREDGVFDDPPA